MKCRMVGLTKAIEGNEYLLTLATGDRAVLASWDKLHEKDVNADLKAWHKKRSLNANAYFHVLVNKIAQEQNLSDTEVKRQLVVDYGAIERDENGDVAGAKIPATVDITKYYPYARAYKSTCENGRFYTCYIFYKQTHTLDSKEMARLIDGAITEAKALGIETLPPHEIEAMEKAWEARP